VHVSDGYSVHRQELKTARPASGICQTNTAPCCYQLLAVCAVLTPDDGRKTRLKHVEHLTEIKKRETSHLVGCILRIQLSLDYKSWLLYISA